MRKPVSKLMDLDIDEVSLVDRGANQHSLVAFSKSLSEASTLEDSMSVDVAVYSETGEEVDVDTLEHGDTVFDAEGNTYVVVDDPEDVEDDGDEVGKNLAANPMGVKALRAAAKGKKAGRNAMQAGRSAMQSGKNYINNLSPAAKYGAAAGAGLAAGVAGTAALKKSFQDEILEDFSKAITDRDREQIVIKMADEVAKAHQVAEEALAWAEAEHEARLEEAYISKAAEYNLPISPAVLGPILKAASAVWTEEQIEEVDRLLTAVGDSLYNEIGFVGGGSNSSVIDQVNALAGDMVTKSGGSREQLFTELLASDPSLYDAYISEMGR